MEGFMTTTAPPPAPDPVTVPLGQVEAELTRQFQAIHQPSTGPVIRARMSNLVIFCDKADRVANVAADVIAALPTIIAIHPARVILLVAEPQASDAGTTATVLVRAQPGPGGRTLCAEEVALHARGSAVEHLPYAVRNLLVGDLPTNLCWASSQPPPLAGPLLYDLAENAQQIIYDSNGWPEPARDVAAVAAWLDKFERPQPTTRWRVASDLNWRRLKSWRRTLSQALDPASAPGALESITEVLIEHGPHASPQAWELTAWAVARLGWRVQSGRIQPGVEMTWQAAAAHGTVRLRIRRLATGPSEVRHVRIACALAGRPGALNIGVEDERRLAVVLEGVDAAPRTSTVQPQPLAELIARQLSDRDRDPVFHLSMTAAEVLARTLLR
jgi:glucose-6-phosphate dehydrogenase assembly protein OpcA